MVNLGRHPNTGKNINLSTENSPRTEQFLKTIKEIRNEVESALNKTNETMKRKWDLKKKPEAERSSEDLVWVDAMHYNSGQPSKKLSAKRLGPFPIILKVGKSAYCQRAKLRAGIKLTALCSAFDKENSIEFPLDFLHYLYNYYMVCALFSHVYHMTRHVTSCDIM